MIEVVPNNRGHMISMMPMGTEVRQGPLMEYSRQTRPITYVVPPYQIRPIVFKIVDMSQYLHPNEYQSRYEQYGHQQPSSRQSYQLVPIQLGYPEDHDLSYRKKDTPDNIVEEKVRYKVKTPHGQTEVRHKYKKPRVETEGDIAAAVTDKKTFQFEMKDDKPKNTNTVVVVEEEEKNNAKHSEKMATPEVTLTEHTKDETDKSSSEDNTEAVQFNLPNQDQAVDISSDNIESGKLRLE